MLRSVTANVPVGDATRDESFNATPSTVITPSVELPVVVGDEPTTVVLFSESTTIVASAFAKFAPVILPVVVAINLGIAVNVMPLLLLTF